MKVKLFLIIVFVCTPAVPSLFAENSIGFRFGRKGGRPFVN